MELLLIVSWLAVFIAPSVGVLHGDEAFAAVASGKWYVFCNGGNQTAGEPGPSIDIVDAGTQKVVNSIAVDSDTSWADSVYMETCSSAKTGGSESSYVLANDRQGHIYVVDAQNQTLVKKIAMSSRPVHSYAIPQRQEFWTHADGAGVMDVVHLCANEKLHVEDIIVHKDAPGHGKLLWDPDLLPLAYVSNTAENYVYEINTETYKMTRHWNFTVDTDHELHCENTHGLAYSRINRHVYATCSDTGLIELNPNKDFSIVGKHANATGGQVYESPDEKYILTIDKVNNQVHILKPSTANAALSTSTAFPSVNTPAAAGGPDKPGFFKKTNGEWRLFFSLTTPNTVDGKSGVGYIDIGTVEDQPTTEHTMTYVEGGSVAKGGYRTYRSITAGGPNVGTIMHYPRPGIMLVNGNTGNLHATVETKPNPSRVLWVPDSYQGLTCSENDRRPCSECESLTRISTPDDGQVSCAYVGGYGSDFKQPHKNLCDIDSVRVGCCDSCANTNPVTTLNDQTTNQTSQSGTQVKPHLLINLISLFIALIAISSKSIL